MVAPSDDEAASQRTACAYERGSLPAETQGASHPMGDEIPLDTILVVMMENRSFDHYFQRLPEYGQPDVDVAPASFTNPDTEGNLVSTFHQQSPCFVDTKHSWRGTHVQLGNGAMNGFVVSNEGDHEQPARGNLEMFAGRRAMGYHDETDLPFYYWLANEFAIADRYFSSVPGPTFPNRMFLYAASSHGNVHNAVPGDFDVIVEYLEQREIDWRIYADATPGLGMYITKASLILEHVVPVEAYFEDAAAGRLPSFAFIDPAIGVGTGQYDNNDEHPPALPQIGEQFVARLVDALAKSTQWSRSAMFITYDEHGGLYDHVAPPQACPPDDIPLKLSPDDPIKGLDRYGLRVPLIVVSPYARRHHVSHGVYDHTSITRFVEARWTMPAMTARDANALAPWDMFDFSAPPSEPPVVTIPTVPDEALAVCEAVFGG